MGHHIRFILACFVELAFGRSIMQMLLKRCVREAPFETAKPFEWTMLSIFCSSKEVFPNDDSLHSLAHMEGNVITIKERNVWVFFFFFILCISLYTHSVSGYINGEAPKMLTTVKRLKKKKKEPVGIYIFGSSTNDRAQLSLTTPPPAATLLRSLLRLRFVFGFHCIGLFELLAALPAQLQPHVDSQEDLTFLWDMFGAKDLHSLVKVNHAELKLLFAEKHMEKYFERHLVNQKSHC